MGRRLNSLQMSIAATRWQNGWQWSKGLRWLLQLPGLLLLLLRRVGWRRALQLRDDRQKLAQHILALLVFAFLSLLLILNLAQQKRHVGHFPGICQPRQLGALR